MQELDSNRIMGVMAQLLPFLFPDPTYSSSKSLKSYQLGNGSSGIITGKKVEINVPFSTDISSQTANFYHTGVQATVGNVIQVSGQTTNNYTTQIGFQIAAADKSTETKSAAVLGHSGKRVYVNGKLQVNGETENDFTKPVVYSIHATDETVLEYTVIVDFITPVSISTINYTVSGTLVGLGTSKSITLQNNTTNNLTLSANGAFTFSTALSNGSSYNVKPQVKGDIWKGQNKVCSMV